VRRRSLGRDIRRAVVDLSEILAAMHALRYAMTPFYPSIRTSISRLGGRTRSHLVAEPFLGKDYDEYCC